MAEFCISSEIKRHGPASFLVLVSRRRMDRAQDSALQLRLAYSFEHAERLCRELSAKMEKHLRRDGHRLGTPAIMPIAAVLLDPTLVAS